MSNYISPYSRNQKVKADIENAFGKVPLSLEQIWCLVKFAKHVRLRCRNNAAFNNFANEVFPYAKFVNVMKTRPDGSVYPGLKIQVGGVSIEEGENEDES